MSGVCYSIDQFLSTGSNFWFVDATSGLIRSHFQLLPWGPLRLTEVHGLDQWAQGDPKWPPRTPKKALWCYREHCIQWQTYILRALKPSNICYGGPFATSNKVLVTTLIFFSGVVPQEIIF